MIDVNIWLSSRVVFKKRVTHGIFGPLLASASEGENVGHANLIVNIDERSKDFERVEQHFENLEPNKTLDIIPVPVVAEKNWAQFAPKLVRSDQFTHSFWPQRTPTATKIFITDPIRAAHLRSGKLGVPSQFENHLKDMKSEDHPDKVLVIQHKETSINSIYAEKVQHTNFIVAINELDAKLYQLDRATLQLETLQKEQVELTIQHQQMNSTHQDKMRTLHALLAANTTDLKQIAMQSTALKRTLNYLMLIQTPDPASQTQQTLIHKQLHELILKKQDKETKRTETLKLIEQLTTTHTLDIHAIENALKKNAEDLSQTLETKKQLELQVNGQTMEDVAAMKKEWRSRVDLTKRKEQFLNAREKTEGKHPDHTIKLPTQINGVPYYLDEIKVLEAMQEERNTNYSFIFHNCSSSTKRCLLAGISQPLRQQLIESGLEKSFFKVHSIETCKSLKSWTETLEAKLIELNTQHQIAQEAHHEGISLR